MTFGSTLAGFFDTATTGTSATASAAGSLAESAPVIAASVDMLVWAGTHPSAGGRSGFWTDRNSVRRLKSAESLAERDQVSSSPFLILSKIR